MKCRNCGQISDKVLVDLGTSPPSNSFLSKEELNYPEAFYPLKVYICERCFLVQIPETKKSREIFSRDYVYFSSFSSSWLRHAKEYCEMAAGKFNLDEKSFVAEIASNDGYLLQYFKEKNIPVLGIEPTSNTAAVAIQKGIPTDVEFFTAEKAKRMAQAGQHADLLIGNNVLAHVPDIHDFIAGLKIALANSGVITMEFPHLCRMIEENQFDTIYHEHYSYLSLFCVKQMFERHGLKIFDVEEIPTHGGSLRVYACHSENISLILSDRAKKIYENEISLGIDSMNYYSSFADKTMEVKVNLIDFLQEALKKGKKVCAYGAAAKGNTLFNYCGITSDLVSFVCDASPHKQNKFLPGSRIEVSHPSRIREEQPDYILILPWNISDEISKELEYVRDWNAKFVTAIPKLKIF
ncbi:MAG: methyltransferase domain-containing protein [Bacteroidetes bacterium]|nr:MAG: methyltransferase domain-containing protein [Bacteroidota bacterium]REJ99718.1 MAG: methyltransferase domain-containing protein [Bacteroidota bacterium]REK32912.1 MAG: methyltransferase domain-containing protein [Bacteroidota bacterium]REK47717.1 MAG: methyltransferase domain-containing protein [Bacteroidota bacterium]